MSDELENKKPKAPLIKHPKPEEVSSTVNDPIVEERKKTVVVVKKKTVVKKKVVVHKDETQNSPTQTHPPVAARPEAVGERKPVEKTSAPTNSSGVTKLSPEKIAEFMAKRPQEMKRVDPTTRPKPEGLRIETDRPPRQERSGSYQDRRPWNGPQGNRPGSSGPSGNAPAGGNRPPRQWADRSQGNSAPNNTQGGPAGQNRPPRPWGDRPPQSGGQGGGRPWGDRPPQSGGQGGGRPWGDRPPQGSGQGSGRPWNGPQGPRPAGTGAPGAPGQNRPPRQWGDRPQGSGGYAGGRPGGFGGGRPGGFSGGRPGSNNNPPALDLAKKVEPKKFRSKKEKNYSKDKEKEELFEKALQQSKKQQNKANPVPKEIEIMEAVTVAELARKMNLKASSLISKLMSMGMLVTINEQIDADTATILASEYGTTIKIVSLYEETLIETEVDKEEDLEVRPPIVTIMGHVDHGKTKLLDAIRTANVAGGEHGGITQHIGAYQVHAKRGDITFLDTPGHEAFTLMRARGAQITDIIVLVVAANDGVMPQTLEAINHAKDAKVPIIVAINKIDLPDANPDKVRQQLSEKGLVPEPWGGQTMYCEISALKKLGLDELLETIALQAEVLELKANKSRLAEGKIIESKIDQGRGVVASVLVQKGTLKIGDFFIGGVFPGKVRAMFNDRGESIKEASPSMPVEILGFDGIPSSGDPFQAMASEREVRDYSEKRQELKKVEEAKNIKKITLANLYSTIQDGEVKELKVIIKGDVHGSVEALQIALEKLSTAEIRLNCIHASAGAIIESDVTLASASDAIIIGFHVRPTAKAQLIAEREKVEIRKYNIIYDAVDDIRTAMEGMLTPDLREDVIGQVQVRETFKVPKIGLIAGCMVTQGKVKRNALVHVIRDGIQIYSGKISSLRRFKDDAKEVVEGFECGIGIDNYQDLLVNDTMEIIEVTKIAKKLGEATTA